MHCLASATASSFRSARVRRVDRENRGRSARVANPFERCGVKCCQPETPKHALRIDPNDLVRATTRVDRKEDGDQAPHDMS